MSRRLAVVLVLWTTASVGACATATRQGAVTPQQDPRVISAAELTTPDVVGMNAYEAILKLRPKFFQDNVAGASNKEGRRLEISVNGGRMRQPADLMSIPTATIAAIRYFTSGESVARFGMRSNLGPVILLTLIKADTALAPEPRLQNGN